MDATGLRQRKKVKLRTALFASAVRLFEERGFAQTSIDDIAAEVDVSRKTFFRYFPSKEDVVVRDEEHKVEIIARCLAERRPPESVPDAIGRGLRELSDYYAAEPDVVRSLYRLGATEPVLAHRLLEHHATWQQAIARPIGGALGVDPVTDVRPHVIAAAALAAARLGLLEWVASGCAGTPAEAVERQFEIARPALDLLASGVPTRP